MKMGKIILKKRGVNMSVFVLNNDNFEKEVLHSDKPVLVDFWASWCMPCQMLGPIVEMVSNEQDEVKCCKVNVDECPMLAEKYGVMSIPLLILFKNGEVYKQSVGVISKSEILEFIQV